MGGVPRGRPTLVTGGPGCGKTLLALQYLIAGATEYKEPGLFVSFEETEQELRENIASLGFDLAALTRRGQVAVDFIRAERSEIEETGDFDLEGLFIRLGQTIDRLGAKRIVLDTLEVLFGAIQNHDILRGELRRLFRWLKERHMTAIITAERGEGSLTRHGLEEYVSDCVIFLDHRVRDQVSTRRLRIVKYRGSAHGTNEYPFIIDAQGFSVLPITSLSLNHAAPMGRMPTGIPELDAMLGGRGLYRGSSTLISGTPGTGKTSLLAHIIDAACARGERTLYIAFEESPQQIMRNMRSIGLDLGRWVERGLLAFRPVRPYFYGLETHLAEVHRATEQFKPQVVAIDPVSNLTEIGSRADAKAMLTRLIDDLKNQGITGLFADLTTDPHDLEHTQVAISSLMDTWVLLRNLEQDGERTRGLYILKSRGMPHSNQIREFALTDRGIQLRELYTGGGPVLTGRARDAQEARDTAEAAARLRLLKEKQRELHQRRTKLAGQIQAVDAELQKLAGNIPERLEQAMPQPEFADALVYPNGKPALFNDRPSATTRRVSHAPLSRRRQTG